MFGYDITVTISPEDSISVGRRGRLQLEPQVGGFVGDFFGSCLGSTDKKQCINVCRPRVQVPYGQPLPCAFKEVLKSMEWMILVLRHCEFLQKSCSSECNISVV